MDPEISCSVPEVLHSIEADVPSTLPFNRLFIGAGSRGPGTAQAPLDFFSPPEPFEPPLILDKLCTECDGTNACNVRT